MVEKIGSIQLCCYENDTYLVTATINWYLTGKVNYKHVRIGTHTSIKIRDDSVEGSRDTFLGVSTR